MEEYSFCAISDGVLPDTVAAEHIRLDFILRFIRSA